MGGTRGFGQSFTVANPGPGVDGSHPSPNQETKTFVVQKSGIFNTKAALKTAVQAYNDNPTAATATYGLIVDWDVSAVTDMSGLFKNMRKFNADISKWDTSGVTNMNRMFSVRSSPCPAPNLSRSLS